MTRLRHVQRLFQRLDTTQQRQRKRKTVSVQLKVIPQSARLPDGEDVH